MSKIKIEPSLLGRAVKGDKLAIRSMFENFISDDDDIVDVQYFGSHGLFKTRCFVCLSGKKIASIQYGPFG